MTHIFRHPKYYKEMRAERRKHQASSAKPQAPRPDNLRLKKNKKRFDF